MAHRKSDARPRWSTSSFGDAPDRSPVELAALGEHLNRCVERRGALFAWRCAGEAMSDFAAPRVVTTLVLCVLLGVFVSLLA